MRNAAIAIILALAATGCGLGAPLGVDLAARAPQGPLPDDADLAAVALDLAIDPREERFGGTATLTLDLKRALDGIWLHGQNLAVSEATLTLADGRVFDASYAEVAALGVSRVTFAETAPAGRATLRLTYDAPFDPNLAGLFHVVVNGDAYALAKSESIQARKYMPSFDEPRFKAPYDVTLTVPAGYAAVGNTPVLAREDAGDGFERVRFATTRPMSSYLLSLAVGPFDVVARDPIPPSAWRETPIPLTGYARRGKGDELDFVLGLTPTFVAAFEEAFAAPYPYPSISIVAAPDWPSGATELAGAPTYREDNILAAGAPDPGQERRIVSIHAHEFSHMWFGDLVTPAWWDELWLKEAFAVWAEAIAARAWDPDGGYDLERTKDLINGLNADELAASRAVRQPITLSADIRNAYDGITYSKGSAVIAMAESYLGPERFRAGVQAILETYADQAVVSEDYYAAVAAVTGETDAADVFAAFIDRPGAPVVRAGLLCSADGPPKLRLSQRRYAPLGSAIDVDETWPIPLCARYGGAGGEGRVCRLLSASDAAVLLDGASCPDWVMPNAGAAGYYRFDLEPEGWAALAAAFADLSDAEALVAVDSAVAGLAAGTTDPESFIAVVEAAARHPSRHVAAAPFGALRRWSERVLDADGAAALAAWTRALYRPRLDALANAQTPDDRLLRSELLGFLPEVGRDLDARADLAARAAAFVGVEGARVPGALTPDLYGAALRVAAEDRGRAFAERLVAERGAIDDRGFQRAALAAAAEARDPEWGAELARLAVEGDLDPTETEILVYSLMGRAGESAIEHETAFAWFAENLDAIAARAAAQRRRFLPRALSGSCDAADVDRLDALFAGADIPGHERALAQTTEAITLCAALKEAVAPGFAAALAARTGE